MLQFNGAGKLQTTWSYSCEVNTVMGNVGLKAKNYCAGKGQQQFTQMLRPLEKCAKHSCGCEILAIWNQMDLHPLPTD
jgi:hypothetical protein